MRSSRQDIDKTRKRDVQTGGGAGALQRPRLKGRSERWLFFCKCSFFVCLSRVYSRIKTNTTIAIYIVYTYGLGKVDGPASGNRMSIHSFLGRNQRRLRGGTGTRTTSRDEIQPVFFHLGIRGIWGPLLEGVFSSQRFLNL